MKDSSAAVDAGAKVQKQMRMLANGNEVPVAEDIDESSSDDKGEIIQYEDISDTQLEGECENKDHESFKSVGLSVGAIEAKV